MAADRRLIAAGVVAAALALLIIYGDYRSSNQPYTAYDQLARQTSTRFAKFEHQVCLLASASRHSDAALRRSLLLLAERAKAREAIDRAAGLKTAAQADADSALLYQELADALNTPAGPPLGCT